MKKRNWLLLLLIVLCLAAFFGYRKLDQLRTDTRAPQIHMDEQPLEVSVRDDKSALLAGPGWWNSGVITPARCGEIHSPNPRDTSRRDTARKGNRAGMTDLAHRDRASAAAVRI